LRLASSLSWVVCSIELLSVLECLPLMNISVRVKE